MQPGQAAIRLRVEVTLEDAEAHSGLIVGLVCILLGVLVPGLGGVGVVVSAPPAAHYAIIVSNSVRPPAAFRLHSKGNGLIDCPSRCPCAWSPGQLIVFWAAGPGRRQYLGLGSQVP